MNTRKLNMNPSAVSSATTSKKSFVKYGGIATVIAAAMAGAAQYLYRHNSDHTNAPKDEHGDNPETDTDSHDEANEYAENVDSTCYIDTNASDNNVTTDTDTETSSSALHAKNTETTDSAEHVEENNDNDTFLSNPEEVAEKIIAELEIDDDDIYDLALIRFDELTTVYNEDGEELNAAIFHLFDETEPFVLVDMNGDGTYTHIFDSNLDFVDIPVLYPFNEDDIRYALEEEMGYIGPKTLLADDDELDDIDFNDIEEAEVAVADDIDYEDEDIRALIESFFDMPFEEFVEVYWDEEDDDEPDPEPEPEPEDTSFEDEDEAYDADDDY